MSDKHAFALKESVDNFVGGAISVGGDARELRLEPLAEGPIVTDDLSEITALSGLDFVKEVPVPARGQKAQKDGDRQ